MSSNAEYITEKEFTEKIDKMCYEDRMAIISQMATLIPNWIDLIGKKKIKLSSVYELPLSVWVPSVDSVIDASMKNEKVKWDAHMKGKIKNLIYFEYPDGRLGYGFKSEKRDLDLGEDYIR